MSAKAQWLRTVLWALGLCLPGLHVHAQDQFVVVEQTYTATSANTMDSHFRVQPNAGTPANWRAPIDYASGKVHARLDIMSKPSAKKTLYNICFEATPSYACMPYSPAYTATGVIDFEYPFSADYQYNDVDWSKGIKDIALILKDENETKPQGSPDYYPTTIHITLTVIKPGATYVPPADTPQDAGMMVDAGEPVEMTPATPDAATPPNPARPAPVDAGHSAAQPDAGQAMAGSTAMGAAMAGSAAPPTTPASNPTPMVMTPAPSPMAGSADAGSAAGAPRSPSEAVGGCASVAPRSRNLPTMLALLLLPLLVLSRARRIKRSR